MQVCGFSGTNDHRQLLPFQVRPKHPRDSSTQATDGHMISVLMRPGKCRFERLLNIKPTLLSADCSYQEPSRILNDDVTHSQSQNMLAMNSSKGHKAATAFYSGSLHGEQLLDAVVHLGTHALIDAGVQLWYFFWLAWNAATDAVCFLSVLLDCHVVVVFF
jgi:hypothetical protein